MNQRFLERKSMPAPGAADLADPLRPVRTSCLASARAAVLDRRILEVEEVTGVIPHEAVLHDGAAIAAGLGLGLEHDHALVRMQLAPPVREPEARHAGADHDDVGTLCHVSLASSLLKILRVIAIAQP